MPEVNSRNIANMQAALDLANAGFAVFPVGPNKRPKIKGWQTEATTDSTTIRRWFTRMPDAMPAIPTGQRNGVAVLDIDRHGDSDGFAALDTMPVSPIIVATPSDGQHVYYLWPEGMGNSAAGLPAGIDVRGEGGFVVAPGAVNAKGTYRMIGDGDVRLLADLRDVGVLPDWPDAYAPRRRVLEAFDGEPTGLPPEVFESALMDCPNDGDDYASRDDWLRMGMALHAEMGEDGRPLWHAWSERHPTYDPTSTDAAFDSFRTGGVTGWHIVHEARRHGWRDATVEEMLRQDDLSDLPEPEPAPEAQPYFIDMADLLSSPAPEREWHVEGWIPAKTVHMMGGDGGTGKSLLAVQMAVATGAGGTWLGSPIMRPGVALYYGAEDDQDELHRRFADVCRAMDIDPAEHSGRIGLRAAIAEDTIFAVADRRTGKVMATPVMKRIEAEIATLKPSLVVLDTLANLHALESNSQEHGKAFISLLIGIAQRTGCTFLLLAHPSRSGMASGDGDGFSVAWSNSVRSRSYFEKDATDPDIRTLTLKKSNYGASGLSMNVMWSNGAFDVVTDAHATASRAKHVFLTILDRMTAAGRHFLPTKGTNYAPACFAGEPEADGITKDQFTKAMTAMLYSGVLTIEEYKTDYKTKKRLTRGEVALGKEEDFTDDLPE